MVDTQEPESNDESESTHGSRMWKDWSPFQRVMCVLGVATLVVAVIFGLIEALDRGTSDTGTSSGLGVPRQPAKQPDNVSDEVASRTFWLASPEMYDFPYKSVEFLSESNVEWSSDDVTAVTPRELALHAVDYKGRTVVLVGRVVEAVSVQSDFGIETEIQFAGQRGANAYVGTSYFVSEGQTVYVVGMVVAGGETRTLDGRRFRTAYLLDTHGFVWNFDPKYFDGSPAIRAAAKKLGP